MSAYSDPLLEVCVDTIQGIRACQDHADRIELCSGLSLGGLTPGPGLFSAVAQSAVPVHAMIRPRAGGFDYTSDDIEICIADIRAARDAGCRGVVIGATIDGVLNQDALARMIAAAAPLHCTLHRAIDQIDDPLRAIDQAAEIGIQTILTSGGASKALDGVDRLAAMHAHAADRLTIMAGSGVSADNAKIIADRTGIRAFHASCSQLVPSDPADIAFGFAALTTSVTDPSKIAGLRTVLDSLDG